MRDGRIKYVQEQCETQYNSEGKPLRSVGTVQDITDRKQAESNQDLSAKILGILNESEALPDADQKYSHLRSSLKRALMRWVFAPAKRG